MSQLCTQSLQITKGFGRAVIRCGPLEWLATFTNADLYEVALWSNILAVDGTELCYNYMVDNQAIVIPETIDAIRALASSEEQPEVSMRLTNKALAIGADELRL